MKILITGHDGFLGRHLVPYLKKNIPEGELFGLSKTGKALKGMKQSACMDLNQPELKELLIAWQPDKIIHLASLTHGSFQELLNNNVMATENLVQGILATGKKTKLIHIGSAAEIGPPDNRQPVNEKILCNPVNYYGLTKFMQSNLVGMYTQQGKIDTIRLRIYNMLGPHMPESLLAGRAIRLIRQSIDSGKDAVMRFGNLTSERDYIDVRDVCRAISFALVSECWNELFDIGSGRSVSGDELIQTLINESPLPNKNELIYTSDNTQKSAVPWMVADNSKAGYKLNWKPEFQLKETIRWIWKNETISFS